MPASAVLVRCQVPASGVGFQFVVDNGSGEGKAVPALEQ